MKVEPVETLFDDSLKSQTEIWFQLQIFRILLNQNFCTCGTFVYYFQGHKLPKAIKGKETAECQEINTELRVINNFLLF